MNQSLAKRVFTLALAPLAFLPIGLKEGLKHSHMYPLYTRIFKLLGRLAGPDFYEIEGGPLRGHVIYVDPETIRAYLLGNYEPDVTKGIQDCCRPGMIVMDVGAHIGYFTILMGQSVGVYGRCISFEPLSENFESICLSVSKNRLRNICVEQMALGGQLGKTKFKINDNRTMGRLGHLVPHQDEVSFSRFEDVPISTLDGYVSEHQVDKIDFIKLDIEGGEWDFVKGAKSTISKNRPVILVEVHTFAPVETHARPFIRELLYLDYDVLDIQSRLPVEIDNFMGGHVLAIPRQ